jgi:AcrR family transcriptional regulator
MRDHFGAVGGGDAGSTVISGRDDFHCAARAEAAEPPRTIASRPAQWVAYLRRLFFAIYSANFFLRAFYAVKSKANQKKLRAERSRAKLLDATISMIAARGLPGFALTNLGAGLGLSRGLASYHFEGGRAQVIATALGGVLDEEPQPEGLGLPALFSWIGELSQRAAARDPKLLALLQLAVGPGVEAEASALRATYWTRQTDLLQRHLTAAQGAGQIRDDLEAGRLAAVLLGQLHGELLRLAATGEVPGPEFTALIGPALAPEGAAPKAGSKARAKSQPQPAKGASLGPASPAIGGTQMPLFGFKPDPT